MKIPETPVAEEITVRALGDVDELPARSWFGWKAFQPDEPEENYAALGWEWYLDIQRCPLYRRDLDIVAVAPNGDIASFCGVWYDDVTRSAYFEPVGTYPPYQRRGLAKAVMYEGLRRVKRMGATVAFVGGYSPEGNALYTSVMGREYALSERWVKEW
jgi:GNAT superfamily N-acetyltransferase